VHLWRDRLGQISLAVTTLFWGAGVSIHAVIVVFGLFVSATMASVQLWFRHSQRRHGDEIERLLDFAAAEDPHRPR
jgi:hypothetical protein